MVLYTNEDGTPISTHSMLKCFRRCPKQAEFKYVHRLKPRFSTSKPLKRGTWVHKLLEVHYSGGDWREEHATLSAQYSKLFDEEKDALGDLPTECARLMRSYLWHYKHEKLIVHEVEFKLEAELPDGSILRTKNDMLVEDEFGLWLWDHKTHKKLPDLTFRMLDAQSAIYTYVALKNKIPVQGFVWNYLRTEGLKIPKKLASKPMLARWKNADLDYPTAVEAIKLHELPVGPHKEKLLYLRSLQWQPGEPQRSTYFRREPLEKKPDMLRRVATETYHTAKRMHSYFPQKNPDAVERVTDRSCSWCDYKMPCQVELFGGNILPIVKSQYRVADPMEYYEDEKERR